ncbi:MAG: hypothetical protein ABIO72_01790 [Patescibacteria group bacterium]
MTNPLNPSTPIKLVEPSDELLLRISRRVREEELFLRFRKRIFFALVGLVFSLIGFAFALVWFVAGSGATGFAEMASLLASDSGYVMGNWQEYSLSLLETLPVINAITSLALLFCVISFGMLVTGNVKGMRALGRLIQH